MSLAYVKKLLAIILLALTLAGCVRIIRHNEDRAASDANKVLKILYFDKKYSEAYERLDPRFRENCRAEDLKRIVEAMKDRLGELEELRIDSFLPMPGQRAITLFYNGVNQKGLSYHQVVLVGDASGYKVTGVFVADQPYPDSKLRKKFNKTIVVK